MLIAPDRSINTRAIMLVMAAMKNTFPVAVLMKANMLNFNSLTPAFPLNRK